MATDSVVIRSSDATDLQINLESFTKVYRVFVCALSKAEGNLPLISAKIVALSLKLLQTPILPRYLVHVPHNTLERISKGLLDLLLRFDDLLDNSIVGHIFFQALPGRGSMRLEVEVRLDHTSYLARRC